MTKTCTTPQQTDVVGPTRNSTFSTSFRRILIVTLTCGGGGSKPDLEPNQPENVSNRVGSERLGDLLNLTPINNNNNNNNGVEMEMEVAVGMLKSEKMVERMNGAKVVRSLTRDDNEARVLLAMMGAIPPLISMIDGGDCSDDDVEVGNGGVCLVEALYALLNLGVANDLNKAAIVQGGAIHKMVKKMNTSKESSNMSIISEAIVANFLSLSALDSNKPILGALGAIPFLVDTLKNTENQSTFQAKQDALRALYNLSLSPCNIPLIASITDATHFLIHTLLEDNIDVADKALSIISNLVSTSEGRKAISQVRGSFTALIDVLSWGDLPGCQEKASYILMVMAHQSYSDRQRMNEAGIGSTLLELTLLGSTLAQKRASRILECLRRLDKGKQVSHRHRGNVVVSAPIYEHSSKSLRVSKEEEEGMISEEKKAVKQLVEQSLENNLRRIVKRANLPQDFVPSNHMKSLMSGSTSKSLPF